MPRKPNAGPYIVSWTGREQMQKHLGFGQYGPMEWVDKTFRVECHTWKMACDKMRELLIDNKRDVSVSFT